MAFSIGHQLACQACYSRGHLFVGSGVVRLTSRRQYGSLPRAMCGVVGIYGHPEAANLAYLGLYALQHRGQESAGIVSSDGERLRWVREMGHVNDIFTAERLQQLRGFAAI